LASAITKVYGNICRNWDVPAFGGHPLLHIGSDVPVPEITHPDGQRNVFLTEILLLAGLYFFIGISGIIKFFTKKGKIQGSGIFFIGMVLIVIYFTFVGTLLQLGGLFIIFRSFLPDFYDYLCRLPFVGSYLSN
jgi:hypothetical protein